MAEKFYAVRKGTKTGIFRSWEECRASVHGYSGAEYKSFQTEEDARQYLDGGAVLQEDPDDSVKIYVDGSFHSGTKQFSYGMVVLLGDREETFCEAYTDEELSSMHNVAGEIKGAEAAMRYAIEHQLPAITIYHDYEGIAKWCLGEWKTNRDGTKAYKAFYEEAVKQVKIRFRKVTGHSGDHYNDLADQLAKRALGLE